MKLILIFLSTVLLSNFISYGLYNIFKIDVDPSLISMVMLTVFIFVPDRWIKKLSCKNYE